MTGYELCYNPVFYLHQTALDTTLAKPEALPLRIPPLTKATFLIQAAPEAAQSTASMAATSATKEEAVARRAAAAETSEEQMVAQQALPVQSEVTRTQQV